MAATPGKEIWLLIEWPESNCGADQILLLRSACDNTLRRLVRVAKCRWKIEQDYQQLKEELGLDHYEGRSWRVAPPRDSRHDGPRFLTLETMRDKKNFWVDPAEDAS